ncbi:MAG TPA: TIGR03560 family F420-dependent LLM class oxidoreductase [Acidimicrobiia bacterium]|nr:TIGR03560 family F420-dependent LLM class oxidoreductase [Acidimicrobiia bacterium]
MSAHPIEFGIYVPQVAFDYPDMVHRARRCESLGFASLWLYDHLWAPGLPAAPSLEGWTLATALLTETTSLRVGHMVLCNNFRHPALLARMATTLDVISNGRLDIGIGSGSVADEHDQTGLAWGSIAERSERLGEALEILTRMFDGGPTTFEGEHYQLRDVPNLPRPVQQPRPPIVVGGAGERYTLPLVARYADVWNVPTYALGELPEKIAALRRACERIGRDPDEIRYSIEAVLALAPDEPSLADVRRLAERRFGGPGFGLDEGGLVGTPATVIDRVGELSGLGFSHFVFFTHDRAADATLELLATDVLPAFR